MKLMLQVAFPKLELLVLKNMHSLREIWSNPSQLELSFPRLKSLYLIKLPNLMHVLDMDSCETICFQSLNILEISSCPMMEVVATIKENATALIKFPYLQSMSLRYLSNFQGFHTERSTLFDGKVWTIHIYIYNHGDYQVQPRNVVSTNTLLLLLVPLFICFLSNRSLSVWLSKSFSFSFSYFFFVKS